ncbi:SubName: Full=Uncharacterized protein {ECO:0000313/EMBL:CCA69515.1} [Serendipita indica DSM 11827]|uniref:Uncharacterized protein n=1 Tax=Serendipita indica (strain DSM 11827) TaxID=1109443 RepID=G4TDY8_SERID|nr:SubName: Full=Uncharacterized protein {ECO:0000313/EMBL:CCA69515.1} [Serendipita indica DSM 11827]CCA69515.1 hypothetical protein PIIN_03454 [Serendipita indica DSM 11827]
MASPPHAGRIQDIENAISSYEAEEERIVNVLSRKLEQLRDEKLRLENISESETESHMFQLGRELDALKRASLLVNTNALSYESDSQGQSVSNSPIQHYQPNSTDPRSPPSDAMLHLLRTENALLRQRLVDTEREFTKATKLNEAYREELIELRRRLGLPVDGLLVVQEANTQPTYQRHRESSMVTIPMPIAQRPSPGPLPIPRPPSQIHRPPITEVNPTNLSMTTSASSPDSSTPASPFPFSPLSSSLTSAQQTGYHTTLTTPASIPPLSNMPPTLANPSMLTYPHVPPPSLSSSVGSPVAMFSPVNGTSRRNSRVAETASLVRRGSRGSSVDRHPRQAGHTSVHGPSIAEQLAEALSR